jgi:hypothetical protein
LVSKKFWIQKGGGPIALLLFLFGFSVWATQPTAADFVSVARYYCQHELWDEALKVTAKLLEDESYEEAMPLYLFAQWEKFRDRPDRRKLVLESLKSLAPRIADDEHARIVWLGLWQRYGQTVVQKESIKTIGKAQLELSRGNCQAVQSLLAALPAEDQDVRVVREIRLRHMQRCEPTKNPDSFIADIIVRDPFHESVLQAIDEAIPKKTLVSWEETFMALKDQWPRALVAPTVERLSGLRQRLPQDQVRLPQ